MIATTLALALLGSPEVPPAMRPEHGASIGWHVRARKLRGRTWGLWGAHTAFFVMAAVACNVDAYKYGDTPAVAFCYLGNMGGIATAIVAIVISVRLGKHHKMNRSSKRCWPNCGYTSRLEWKPRRRLTLWF